ALTDPSDVSPRPCLARESEDSSELDSLRRGSALQEPDEHEGSLALPDVPRELLPVATVVADQVQEVVLNLKRGAKKEGEAHVAIERNSISGSDDCAEAARIDRAVPARLLQDHAQIVGLVEVEPVVAPPRQLHRLPLDRLVRHPLRFLQDAQREAGA